MKDLIIIGGGPSAMSAGVYAARRKLDITLITRNFGGHVGETDVIENYLGFESIKGTELVNNFEKHLRSYNIEILEDTVAEKIYQKNSKIIVKLENGKYIEARTAIVATGSMRKKLNIPGEKEFENKGVTYCSVCDGPFFKDQSVAVAGGGYSGTKSALYLSKIAKKVYLFEAENNLKSEQLIIDALKKTNNVEIITGARITEIFGNKGVEGLKYKISPNGQEKELAIQGISIEIGIIPNSNILNVKKNSFGQIVVDSSMRTSSNRIFAIGDVNDQGPEQIAVAVGQGCIAALKVDELLSKKRRNI